MSVDSTSHDGMTPLSPGERSNSVESNQSLKNHSYDDEIDENDEHDESDHAGNEELHELFHLSGENRSIHMASSDDDTDDFSVRRWRSVLKSSRTNYNNPQSTNNREYEYGHLDQDVLNRRVGCVLGTKLKLLFAVVLAIFVGAMFIPNDETTEETKPVARKYKGAPQYVCPVVIDEKESDTIASTDQIASLPTREDTIQKDHVFIGYRNNSELINLVNTNTSFFKTSFRDMEYMNWSKTYNEVKEGMKHWKISRFLPNLKTGDSIFESGCGIGLSLLLTAELLQDENVRDLHLYGTDFGVSAAGTANLLLDAVLSEADNVGGGKRGAVCAADSTKLSFIPDGSFDFVFASRISPEQDPWEDVFADTETTPADILERRREICATKDITGDWKSAALYSIALERQMAWYGQWVAEMVRIAKPGVPVVMEQVSDPFCDAEHMDVWGGGGVPQDFWLDGIERYNWDVDPESLNFEADMLFQNEHHYHVFMRKRHRVAG